MYDIKLIGQVIKYARIENGFSQEQLAELIDITPTHLKHIESGHRKPSIEVFFKLLNTLEVSAERLNNQKQNNVPCELAEIFCKCTPKEIKLIENIAKVIIDNR